MENNCSFLPYKNTGFFSKLVLDYVSANKELEAFYHHPVSIDGIEASIEARKNFATDRDLLVTELKKQYQNLPLSSKQHQHLQALLSNDTFTITTAHQPNIFTGPLYFIYKIMHVIKLADELKTQLPQYGFVPVFYMGCEDADLDELGYINLGGEKLVWQTNQTGAVGRMKVDKALLALIDSIYGQVGVHEFGDEFIGLFRNAYTVGKTIQQATLELVNSLFAAYGLLVVIPDNAALKASFNKVVEKEITTQFSHKEVEKTINQLGKHYKVQAGGRELNLFYLLDDKRERIELNSSKFSVESLGLEWDENGILNELNQHPERFSANVILRGVFQETILPNIAFIGGGGELAYWLELKNVFEAANVPYPMLVLRNSFLFINQHQQQRLQKLGFTLEEFFKNKLELINEFVKRNSLKQVSLETEKDVANAFYKHLKLTASAIDTTLANHTESLQTKALQLLNELEKKMLRAEKRHFTDHQNQIQKLKQELFPNDSLQERTENFSGYYAKYGREWLQIIYDNSQGLEQQFGVIAWH